MNVPPEVEHDGEQRSYMDRDIQENPLIRPSESDWNKDEVRRGTDREELRDSLNHGQNNNVEKSHDRYRSTYGGVPNTVACLRSDSKIRLPGSFELVFSLAGTESLCARVLNMPRRIGEKNCACDLAR